MWDSTKSLFPDISKASAQDFICLDLVAAALHRFIPQRQIIFACIDDVALFCDRSICAWTASAIVVYSRPTGWNAIHWLNIYFYASVRHQAFIGRE